MPDAIAVLHAELPRKSIHLLAVLIPPVSILFGRTLVISGLAAVTVLYALAEYLRVHRARRTAIIDAYSRLFRVSERARGRMVATPIYLAIGVLTCLVLFPEATAYAAIMLVGLGDGLARIERLLLTGETKGRTGSGIVSFSLGFLAAGFFVDPLVAFPATVVAYLLEAFPTRLNDNITVPLGAAFTITFLEVTGLASAISPAVIGLDLSAYWWLAENRSPLLYAVFLSLEYILPVAYAALGLFYTFRNGWKAGAHLGAATLAMILIGLAAKSLIGRPRPCVYFHGQGVPSCPVKDYSFPGLHATLAGTFLAYPVRLPPRHGLAWRAATTLFALMAAFIGPYTGIHWISDVAAGFLLSTTLTLGTRQLHIARPPAPALA